MHPWLKDVHQASVWFNAVCQASVWLNIAQCCASTAQWCACIWHQYGLMLSIKHHHGTIWLNVVQASIYGPMLCIINIYGSNLCIMYHWLDAVHPWLKLCIMHQYGSINAAWFITLHHTLFTSFIFATFVAVNYTWRKEIRPLTPPIDLSIIMEYSDSRVQQ